MSQKRYIVDLTNAEVQELEAMLRTGKHAARKLTRARILLQVHQGKTDREVADNVGVNLSTVERTREKFVHSTTLEEALNDRPHPPKLRKLNAKAEALLIATACSDASNGRAQWTMQLSTNRLVELKVVESISDETVRQTLKKTTLNRGNGVFLKSMPTMCGAWRTYWTCMQRRMTPSVQSFVLMSDRVR